jgi:hypothetical protein
VFSEGHGSLRCHILDIVIDNQVFNVR